MIKAVVIPKVLIQVRKRRVEDPDQNSEEVSWSLDEVHTQEEVALRGILRRVLDQFKLSSAGQKLHSGW